MQDDVCAILGMAGWPSLVCCRRLFGWQSSSWRVATNAACPGLSETRLEDGFRQQLASGALWQAAIHHQRPGDLAGLSATCFDQYSSDIAPEVHHVTLSVYHFPVNGTPFCYGFEINAAGHWVTSSKTLECPGTVPVAGPPRTPDLLVPVALRSDRSRQAAY